MSIESNLQDKDPRFFKTVGPYMQFYAEGKKYLCRSAYFTEKELLSQSKRQIFARRRMGSIIPVIGTWQNLSAFELGKNNELKKGVFYSYRFGVN